MHPCAAPATWLTALQPPLVTAITATDTASTNPGTYLKLLPFFMKDLLGFDAPRRDAPHTLIDEAPRPSMQAYGAFGPCAAYRFTVQHPGMPMGIPDATNDTTPMHWLSGGSPGTPVPVHAVTSQF